MDQPDIIQPYLPQYTPPKKRFPVAAVVITAVVLFVALVVVAGTAFYRGVQEKNKAAIVGIRFMDEMGVHDYRAASALFTPEMRARASVSDLKDLEEQVEKHHGTYVNHGQLGSWNVQERNGQTYVRLAFPAQYTGSISIVDLTLVKSNGRYLVFGAHYQT